MARLPEPSSDEGIWGNVLNDFLEVEHNADGSLKKSGDIAAAAAAAAQAQATADAKYTKPSSGIPESDLDAAVVAQLGNNGGIPADGSVDTQQLADGAVTDAKVAPNAAIDQSKINGLAASLSGKASTTHTHIISQVNGLQAALDNKVDVGGAAGSLDSLTDVDTTGVVDGNALVYSGGVWSAANVVDGGSGGSIPDDNSVSSVKLTTAAVTTTKIADLNVTGVKIANSTITASKIADVTITNAKIADATISEGKLDSATQAKLNASATVADGSITDVKIAAGAAIAQSKIANLTTTLSGKAATTHVHAATDLTSGVIATARLAGSGTASSTTYLRGDGTWATPAGSNPTLGGDLTGTASAAQIAAGVIVNADISASAAIDQTKINGLSTSLAAKASIASPTFTGSVTVPTPTSAAHAATKSYVDGAGDLAPVTSGIFWTGSVNASSLAVPGMHRRALSGNTVLTAFPQPASNVSGTMSIKIIQASSGGPYTITWPSGIYWAKGKTAPAAPTAAGDWIIVHFLWDGLYWSGVFQGEYAD